MQLWAFGSQSRQKTLDAVDSFLKRLFGILCLGLELRSQQTTLYVIITCSFLGLYVIAKFTLYTSFSTNTYFVTFVMKGVNLLLWFKWFLCVLPMVKSHESCTVPCCTYDFHDSLIVVERVTHGFSLLWLSNFLTENKSKSWYQFFFNFCCHSVMKSLIKAI